MNRLIIVEDDYQIRNGLSRFFPWSELGFTLVGSFENGLFALEYLRQSPVDVVLTDVRMPVMDGLELMERMRAEGIDALVVILTAYRDFNYAQRAISLGLTQYLVKSARYDDLVGVFRRVGEALRHQPLVAEAKAAADRTDDFVSRAKRYIDGHISTASLQTLSQHVGLSPVYMSRLFKEKTGVNFVDYLIEAKMRRAAELLLHTAHALTQISEETGYSNEQNFSRAFKKYFGVSPNEYRKLH